MLFLPVSLGGFALHLKVFFHLLYALLCGQSINAVLILSCSCTVLNLDSHVVQVVGLTIVIVQQSGIFLLCDTLGEHARAELVLSVVYRCLNYFGGLRGRPADDVDHVFMLGQHLDDAVIVNGACSRVQVPA